MARMETNYTNFFVFNIFSLCHSRESGNDTGALVFHWALVIGHSMVIGYLGLGHFFVFGLFLFLFLLLLLITDN